MSYNIHITKQAEQDIVDAADYIEFTLLNPDAADSLLDAVEANINSLSQMPDRFRLVDDPLLSSWEIRFIIIKNYLAFYVISEEEKLVHIIRFLYGKRNWLLILGQGFSLD
ncbi:MAG: type II toxin-antitoxin system RelE/ParE family toxin [Lachnospiraceae bacterium]|nr:type II toxin-antitoxin system RelE/ParE family toxin [Lachnospiraceae bacterium]